MTDPEQVAPGELETYTPPAVVVRAVYDEDGRLNSLMTEYQHPPHAEEVARVLAQFLMPRHGQILPQRTAGEALDAIRRDPVLAQQFEEVTSSLNSTRCTAAATVPNPPPGHDDHLCRRPAHEHGEHQCQCGQRFGP